MIKSSRQLTVRQGFTLVELLIVMVIIMILIIIGVAGMGAIEDDAARNKTKLALRNAQMVIDEFKEVSGGKIMEIANHSDMNSDIDLEMRHKLGSGPVPPELEGRTYLLKPWDGAINARWKDGQFNSGSSIVTYLSGGGHGFDYSQLDTTLARIPDDILYATGYGVAQFRDGWGNILHYAHWVTDNESILPQHPRPFWASPGPDGKLGDATEDVDGDGVSDDVETTYDEDYHVQWAKDNMYSFEVD